MRILSLEEVQRVLETYYGLSYEVAKDWSQFYVNKNLGWNGIHAITHMAIHRNSEPQEILGMIESWTEFYEAHKNETNNQISG